VHAAQTVVDLSLCGFHVLLSQCYWAKGRVEEALLLPSAPLQSDPTSAEIAARLRNQKGFMLAQTGKFREAREELAEALRLAEECGLDGLVADIQINRGTLFFYLADYDSMEQCARSALAIAEKMGTPEGSACAGIGKCFRVRQHWDEAIQWYERALLAFTNDGSGFYASWMQSELGCCYLVLREYDRAMQLFSEALKYSQEAGALASQHTDLANIGLVHLSRSEYAAAISDFQKALEIARGLGDEISIGNWLRNLATTYSRMGNPSLSATYQKEAEEVAGRVNEARARAAS
jgi:tetratricopeptide (TPR) repeat protein